MNTPSRTAPAFVLAACAAALGSALIAQYVFGLQPCNLCLIQRVPFVLGGALAALALAAPSRGRLLLGLAGALLVVNGGIAFYHVGVEHHWWASAVCSGGGGEAVAVDDLLAQMSKPVEVPCDLPAWSFHGITMAAMNIPFSAGLGLLTLALARRMGRP